MQPYIIKNELISKQLTWLQTTSFTYKKKVILKPGEWNPTQKASFILIKIEVKSEKIFWIIFYDNDKAK